MTEKKKQMWIIEFRQGGWHREEHELMKVPLKSKGNFYQTDVRPVLLYQTECWVVWACWEKTCCMWCNWFII